MKTTVRTANNRFEVRPSAGVPGYVDLNIFTVAGEYLAGGCLTADQAGALIFGIEQALETHEVAAQRVAA